MSTETRLRSRPTRRPTEAPRHDMAVGHKLERAQRCAWTVVWVGTLIAGLNLWSGWTSWTPSSFLAPLFVLVGLGGAAATWRVERVSGWWLQGAALGSVVLATLAQQGVGIHARQYYATDSAAFNQVAAHLLQRGVDPYSSAMDGADRLLQVPSNFWTYLMDGGYVNHLSYPAGSFLLQMPAVLLGFHHEIVDWLDLVAWLATAVLVFFLVPGYCRWVGPLLLIVATFANVFANGGTDAAFLPFLVVAVWQWDRFGADRRSSVVRWLGPIALGLACSIKQTPWFCVPFLVTGVFIEARAADRRPVRVAASYLGVVAAAFAAVNLPFVVWGPRSWLSGITLPFAKPLVADGQGLVSLGLHGPGSGVWLPPLSVAGLLVVVGLWIVFVGWYPALKRSWLFILPVSFFVAPRSLSTYLLDLAPVAIVAAVAVLPAPQSTLHVGSGRTRFGFGLAAASVAAATGVVSAIAFLLPPLSVDVLSVRHSDGGIAFDSVTLSVANDTAATVQPHFMVDLGNSHPGAFWNTAGNRPVVLGPHQQTVVTLYPVTRMGSPGRGQRWIVQAFTPSPDAVSISSTEVWRWGLPG